MKNPSKPGVKPLAPETEALLAELIADLPAWAGKSPALAARLAPFPPEERETFFARLLDRAGERVLPLCERLAGNDPGVDAALARGFGDAGAPWAVEFLARWAGRKPSKNIGKEIRKSLFRLKSKGLPAADLQELPPAIFRPPKTPSAEGYVSALDARGARFLWIGRPQLPQGMVVFHAAVSDTEGIRDFVGFETSGKKFHELLERTRRDFPGDVVEADPDYGEALIHEAHDIQIKQGKTPHPEYVRWKTLLSPPPAFPIRPLVYRYLSEAEFQSRPDLLDRSPSLFETAPFQAWYLDREEIAKCLELLEEASRSRIILAPHQQESRFFDIFRQTVRELFGEKRRLLFRRRLEEMAYVLWKQGDETAAKISLAAAREMAAEDKFLSPHPFLAELVKRTALAFREEAQLDKEKEKEGGVIIRP